jgi:hypothetical protein
MSLQFVFEKGFCAITCYRDILNVIKSTYQHSILSSILLQVILAVFINPHQDMHVSPSSVSGKSNLKMIFDRSFLLT